MGAPNVGKSSLVQLLSSGLPEVQNYPFTTRSIKMGHFYVAGRRHQVTGERSKGDCRVFGCSSAGCIQMRSLPAVQNMAKQLDVPKSLSRPVNFFVLFSERSLAPCPACPCCRHAWPAGPCRGGSQCHGAPHPGLPAASAHRGAVCGRPDRGVRHQRGQPMADQVGLHVWWVGGLEVSELFCREGNGCLLPPACHAQQSICTVHTNQGWP